jgi:transposase
LDTLQTNTTIISASLCVEGQKLWRWYHDSLSGFMEEGVQKEQHKNDIIVHNEKGKETVRVPILKPENIGKNMAIDEKQIGEEMHTILSNRDTGKIAVLAESVNAMELEKIIEKAGNKTDQIETVTRDMSGTYKKFCNDKFYNASHIADKYHIISSAIEACQAVRVRHRQEAMREKRLLYQEHKQKEKEYKRQCLEQDKSYQASEFSYAEETLTNGETVLEALARSRYLLFKYKSDWTIKQEERAKALFKKYPEIEKSYNLICDFRDWIKKDNVGKDLSVLKKRLIEWFNDVEQSCIDEIQNFKSMIERDLLAVLNYFKFGATNAIAENINSRIQRFIMINQGTRDREFFYFRVNKYFS